MGDITRKIEYGVGGNIRENVLSWKTQYVGGGRY